ncbi:Mis6-domain-containing protein [Xylariaceae sp. FL0804]|nr:Mis6-domain-containing protein [Xylariaceae sp. FL0804]
MPPRQDDGPPGLPSDLHANLTDVVQASRLPAKQRGTSVKPTVDTLTSLCYEQGLLPDDLNELIDLVTVPTFLDQASLASIVRSLYPATTVRRGLVVKVVGCLGHGKLKPSLALQAALLRWLVMIYHVLEDQAVLVQAYPVLFNLLDTAAIRPQLCHLLALVTRRRHVRPYRIQSLLSLSRQTGNDPSVVGLLRVFKDYYPEIIVGDATRGKASAFKHPDLHWRERLDEIQQAHAQRTASRSEKPLSAFRVARHRLAGRKTGLVPEVHTAHATETSVTLEEIENVDAFVKHLETIELPSQLIAILSDPLLQKFLLLRPQAEAHQRVSNWLTSYAQDLLGGNAEAQLVDVLEILESYVSTTKTFPPVFLAFFNELLKTWDSRNGTDTILKTLTFTPLLPFKELSEGILFPLEAVVLGGNPNSQLDILRFYTGLLHRWTIYLESLEQTLPHAASAVAGVIGHVNNLCLTLAQSSPETSTHSQILDFYDAVTAQLTSPRLLGQTRIVIPPSPLVYVLHFSGCPVTVSRLCAILAQYKEAFQQAMTGSRSQYSPGYINEFNGFLMDICNCIWRSRALRASDVNSHGCLVPAPLVERLTSYVDGLATGASLAMLFSLSYSPVFGLFAISYFRQLEDMELDQGSGDLDTRHGGPVTRASLNALASKGGLAIGWDEYRLGVLDHLEKQGMGGVSQLMSNTMTTLMRRKSGQ